MADDEESEDTLPRSPPSLPLDRLRLLSARHWLTNIRRLQKLTTVKKYTKVAIIAGAVAGGIGGGMEGPLTAATATAWSVTLKGVLVWAGAIVGAVGAAFLLSVEEDDARAIDEAHDLAEVAQDYVTSRDGVLAELDQLKRSATRLDRKRRERLLAIAQMCEIVEAAIYARSDTLHAVRLMMEQASVAIHRAMEFDAEEDFLKITIFRRETRDGEERMYPICHDSTDAIKCAKDNRSWSRGWGYTGVVWARAETNKVATVVIRDTTVSEVALEYPVENADAGVEALYKSVAAIPILTQETDEIWGVVTATIDRRGGFERNAGAVPGAPVRNQNVEVVRDIARFVALLAALDHLLCAGPVPVVAVPRPRARNGFIQSLLNRGR